LSGQNKAVLGIITSAFSQAEAHSRHVLQKQQNSIVKNINVNVNTAKTKILFKSFYLIQCAVSL